MKFIFTSRVPEFTRISLNGTHIIHAHMGGIALAICGQQSVFCDTLQ